MTFIKLMRFSELIMLDVELQPHQLIMQFANNYELLFKENVPMVQ